MGVDIGRMWSVGVEEAIDKGGGGEARVVAGRM